jgi:hypothetical protein
VRKKVPHTKHSVRQPLGGLVYYGSTCVDSCYASLYSRGLLILTRKCKCKRKFDSVLDHLIIKAYSCYRDNIPCGFRQGK